MQPMAALLGKLPGRPDFVREACPGPCADALDAWLVEAAAPLSAAGALPQLGSVSFCYCVRNRSRALLGVLAPSRDSAGRAFPVAVFCECNFSAWRPRLGELFLCSQDFLAAAGALICALPDLDGSCTRQRLRELPQLPNPEMRNQSRLALPARAGSFLRRVVGFDPPDGHFYALSTLLAAFADAAHPTGLALDCPVRDECDAAGWLELAARLSLRAGNGPSCLFAPAPARLLLSVSEPIPELLRALADPSYVCAQVWPLSTTSRDAIECARAALSPLLPELASEQRDIDLHKLAERLARTSHGETKPRRPRILRFFLR
jgi:type VI secretion system protein ImpM